MCLDHRKLLIRESGGFIYHFIRYADLSDIVKKSHHKYGVLLLPVISESFCYLLGVLRNTQRVTVCICILGINRRCQ